MTATKRCSMSQSSDFFLFMTRKRVRVFCGAGRFILPGQALFRWCASKGSQANELTRPLTEANEATGKNARRIFCSALQHCKSLDELQSTVQWAHGGAAAQ